MELRHLRYFLAVAEELSFTRAAEKLMIAQPPLSRQIHDLEEELGVQLFIRNPRSLQLTEEGILMKQQAKQILSLVDKSTEEVRELKNGLTGMICIASVEGRAPRMISRWIADFSKQYPQVQYSIWNGNSDDVIDRLVKGLCDLAVIVEPYNTEGLHGLPVYEEPWIAMIPADHPLAKLPGDTLPVVRLSGQDLIVPSRRSRIQEIREWLAPVTEDPHIRCEMAHMMNAYELTEHGLGIALYPASAAMMARSGGVVTKVLTDPSMIARYVLIWNKNRQLTHVSQSFLDFVESQYDVGEEN